MVHPLHIPLVEHRSGMLQTTLIHSELAPPLPRHRLSSQARDLRDPFFFFLMIGRPPSSTLFPYTPLFRSPASRAARSRSAATCDPNASTGPPPATSARMSSSARAGGAAISTTARSQSFASCVSRPPPALTTAASFERNTRSRVASTTRLAIERLRRDRSLCGWGRPADEVQQRGAARQNQDRIPGRRLGESLEHEERWGPQTGGRPHSVTTPVPHHVQPVLLPAAPLPLHEHVVIDLPDARIDPFARAVEPGIERLALVALEVLLCRPIVRLECPGVGAPLEVVPQLVRERLPRLRAPVEVAQPGEGGERAVIQHDARLQVGAAAAPAERDALAE